MFKRIVTHLLERRHYWRYVDFSELAELYASASLRSVGLSLVGIFVPIYLYKIGYQLSDIFLFMACLFLARLAVDVVAGYIVALKGPKHTMRYSYTFQIIALLMLLNLPQMDWPLWVIAAVSGASLSLYFVAYHVDFSKVMHSDHGGKELGFMTIIERFGAAIGPLIGGIVATVFGAEYTIAAAVVLFILAAIPLFLTAEPTQTHQLLNFKGLPFAKLKADLISSAGLGAENTLSFALWPLFIAVTILTTNTYAGVGFVTSAGVITAILTARLIGQVVDRHKGGLLLKWSAFGNAALHIIRPFINSFSGVLVTNIANEALTTGYRLPYVKGMYSRADDLPGLRIVYIVYMELAADAGKVIVWVSIWLLSLALNSVESMQVGFVIAAATSLIITVQRFPTLAARHE